MKLDQAAALLSLSLLGSCSRSSEPAATASSALNSGLAVREMSGTGELRLLVVAEEDQGLDDRDGDGDSFGRVWACLDLRSGLVRNLGLAVPPRAFVDQPLPVMALDDSAGVVKVSEREQGQDFNGDGDRDDVNAFLFESGSDELRDLGQFVVRAVLGEGVLAYALRDENDSLRVRTLADGVELVLPFALPVAVSSGVLAFEREEGPGQDWNGDGDETDARVLEFYDLATERALPGAWAFGGGLTFVQGHCGFYVDELAQGSSDLDGDGDSFGLVFHVLDLADARLRNMALASSGYSGALDPDRFLVWVWEFFAGLDLNGDGDEDDSVLHTCDPLTDRVVNTGLAALFAQPIGEWLAVQVYEPEQGAQDLDGDGQVFGTVTTVLHPASGRAQNLQLRSAFGSAQHLLGTRSEAQADWNADGDRDDAVLFAWNPVTEVPTNLRLAAYAILGLHADRVLWARNEFEGTDLNDDGDTDDLVLGAYDLRTSTVQNLALAIASAGAPSASGRVPVLVPERTQGQVLNGDDDTEDMVLHVIAIGP